MGEGLVPVHRRTKNLVGSNKNFIGSPFFLKN